MKLAINTNVFSSWNGGIDFIRLVIRSLTASQHEHGFELYLYYPKDTFLQRIKNFLSPFKSALKFFVLTGNFSLKFPTVSSRLSLLEYLLGNNTNISVLSSRWGFCDSKEFSNETQIDVILPCLSKTHLCRSRASVGYIYDCQHLRLTTLFTRRQKSLRDQDFISTLNSHNVVLVHSNDTKNDIINHYSPFSASVHVLPVAPVPEDWYFDDLTLDLSCYGIDKPFFIISNQFWKHKDHITAFKAFSLLQEKTNYKFKLVCTGLTCDYRFPRYFPEITSLLSNLNISSDVVITGLISKRDQISIMKKALAVVQPSLFEGTPGGGSSYDAVSLGLRLLVSATKVNSELCGLPFVEFFTPSDDFDLFHKMFLISQTVHSKPSISKLKKQAESYSKLFSQSIISSALNAYSKI